MERPSTSALFPIGSPLPKFSLPSVSGKVITDDYLRESKFAFVVFGCNHCPYVQGSEQQFLRFIIRHAADGLRSVVISSNDPIQYPEDSFKKMKEKWEELGKPYEYLFDEKQEIAKSFDAQCTPECYLFNKDMKLCFHGSPNDNPRDPGSVTFDNLSVAFGQLLAGIDPDPAFVHPIGCSIKWKPGNANR